MTNSGIKVYTSYFSKMSKLPEGVVPISIALYSPMWLPDIKKCGKLSPSPSILKDWKEEQNEEVYIERFNKEVLSKLSQDSVVSLLSSLSGGKDVCLLCYEKSSDFCHRHLIAKWLIAGGYECKELN